MRQLQYVLLFHHILLRISNAGSSTNVMEKKNYLNMLSDLEIFVKMLSLILKKYIYFLFTTNQSYADWSVYF